MTDGLKKETLFLHYFVKLSDKEKKSAAKQLTKSQTTAISQVIYNAIKGTFKIDKAKLSEIKRHRTALYNIADKKTPFVQKRNIISRWIHPVVVILKEGLKWIPLKH